MQTGHRKTNETILLRVAEARDENTTIVSSIHTQASNDKHPEKTQQITWRRRHIPTQETHLWMLPRLSPIKTHVAITDNEGIFTEPTDTALDQNTQMSTSVWIVRNELSQVFTPHGARNVMNRREDTRYLYDHSSSDKDIVGRGQGSTKRSDMGPKCSCWDHLLRSAVKIDIVWFCSSNVSIDKELEIVSSDFICAFATLFAVCPCVWC